MREFFLLSLLLLSEVEGREERRFLYSYEQGSDDSCGLQALACLLGLYWGFEVSEEGLAADCATDGEGETRSSFADMLVILSKRGFRSAAYEVEFGGLVGAATRYAPLIVHYARPVGHFALALAASADVVVVADPAHGLLALSREDFVARWDGYILLAALPGSSPRSSILERAVAEALGTAALLEEAALRKRSRF